RYAFAPSARLYPNRSSHLSLSELRDAMTNVKMDSRAPRENDDDGKRRKWIAAALCVCARRNDN
ncbi:MAG: hypothetical protein LBH29_02610, partial [Elusimicrobiota bacterium]|nr:hypothetical protein [Elusimicrobiota bacterium]